MGRATHGNNPPPPPPLPAVAHPLNEAIQEKTYISICFISPRQTQPIRLPCGEGSVVGPRCWLRMRCFCAALLVPC
jgi:hypothetical protein